MTAIDTLLAQGWREYPDQFNKYARCFYKQHATPTRCHCNDDKEGIQVCIAVYEVDEHRPKEGFEVDLCGELKDGSWIKLKQWSLTDLDGALAVIPRLLSTWEHVANL